MKDEDLCQVLGHQNGLNMLPVLWPRVAVRMAKKQVAGYILEKQGDLASFLCGWAWACGLAMKDCSILK